MVQVAQDVNVAVEEIQLVQLQDEHAALELRLEQLDALIYLTPDEQLERKTIQKQKLRLKDRMTSLKPS